MPPPGLVRQPKAPSVSRLRTDSATPPHAPPIRITPNARPPGASHPHPSCRRALQGGARWSASRISKVDTIASSGDSIPRETRSSAHPTSHQRSSHARPPQHACSSPMTQLATSEDALPCAVYDDAHRLKCSSRSHPRALDSRRVGVIQRRRIPSNCVIGEPLARWLQPSSAAGALAEDGNDDATEDERRWGVHFSTRDVLHRARPCSALRRHPFADRARWGLGEDAAAAW